MRDVAALAGVSLKTVSRVINGETTVASDLAARVHEAASSLGYRPNVTARSLRRANGHTRTIGLLLEDVANPFSSALHRAVEDAARERGIAVLAGSVDEDPARERELALEFLARRVDGLIIVPTGDDQSYLASDQRAGARLVFADRPPQLLRADAVVSASASGARDAVLHLGAHGHRRIAFLADLREIPTASARFDGYLQALSELDINLEEDLVRFDLHSPSDAQRAAHDVLTNAGATALFATQNLITVGALRALRELRLHHRVAFVGFDDLPLADLLVPGVTVVAQDPAAIGVKAFEVLLGRMRGDDARVRLHTVRTRLIKRGSGEIRAADPD